MKNVSLFFLLAFPFTINAQHREADGGGVYSPGRVECFPAVQRMEAQAIANANIASLEKEGKLSTAAKSTAVLFDWPLEQATGYNYYSIYGVSNFVDNDLSYPNQLQDYNCGSRTYDLSSGYNHGGMDIFLWPFYWNMMQTGQARIVAAAAGTIIAKHDGEFDQNCAMGSATSNYIFLQHTDGTRTWYLHMKSGSLTTKNVGDAVNAGEFLGLVGSSGSSTGPHLHFEVHNASDVVIDPFNGPCNTTASMWNNQIAYTEPQINTLMTHFAAPSLQPCPNPDIINKRDTFAPGSTVYLAAYYHDQSGGQITNFNILRPDNSVYNTWSHNGGSGGYIAASYWYWSYTIPGTQPQGEWTFRAVYQGDTYEHKFYILFPAEVANVEAEERLLYPNPASNMLSFDTKVESIQVLDLLGRTVLNESGLSNGQLDISALEAGLYYARMTVAGKVHTQKISVQR